MFELVVCAHIIWWNVAQTAVHTVERQGVANIARVEQASVSYV